MSTSKSVVHGVDYVGHSDCYSHDVVMSVLSTLDFDVESVCSYSGIDCKCTKSSCDKSIEDLFHRDNSDEVYC